MAFPPPPPPPPPPKASKARGGQQEQPICRLDEEISYLIQPLFHASGGDTHSDGNRTVITFVHAIHPVLQDGPQCGLVAISMALQLLQSSAQDSMATLLDPTASHPNALLTVAKSKGLSNQGEMFSVDYMLEVARHSLRGSSCRGEVVESASLNMRTVTSGLIDGKAILVPYDADKNHTPCLARGHKAHWSVLVGFAVILDNNDLTSGLSGLLECCSPCSNTLQHYTVREDHKDEFRKRLVTWTSSHSPDALRSCLKVFVRHGKSRHMGLWELCSLLRSNECLVETDPKRTDPSEYVVPVGGIAEGLCSKALILLCES